MSGLVPHVLSHLHDSTVTLKLRKSKFLTDKNSFLVHNFQLWQPIWVARTANSEHGSNMPSFWQKVEVSLVQTTFVSFCVQFCANGNPVKQSSTETFSCQI